MESLPATALQPILPEIIYHRRLGVSVSWLVTQQDNYFHIILRRIRQLPVQLCESLMNPVLDRLRVIVVPTQPHLTQKFQQLILPPFLLVLLVLQSLSAHELLELCDRSLIVLDDIFFPVGSLLSRQSMVERIHLNPEVEEERQ